MPIENNPYPGQLPFVARMSAGLYRLNMDDARGLGGCPENGTILCPVCFGMWAREDEDKALSHRERGACTPGTAERTARFIPLNYEALFRSLVPRPILKPPDPMDIPWWRSW